MSKSARKRRPVKKQHKPHHQPKPEPKFNFKSPVIAIIVTVVLAAIPFSMGKYIEFNSPDPYDSGCYVYSAQKILNGARIGIDEKPSAQVGTLLINMLGVKLFGFNETGPKLIQMLLQAAAFVLMFIAMRKLFGTLAASIGVIVASIYLSAPLIAKFGNVKEQHMIAFMIMGMSCFVLYQLNGKWWCAMMAGALLSFAPLFKETGTSVLAAVGLFVILQPILKHCSWKKTGFDILWLVTGAVAIVIIPISLWLAVGKTPIHYYPYSFVYRSFFTSHQTPVADSKDEQVESDSVTAQNDKLVVNEGLIMKILPSYVSDSWRILGPEQRKQTQIRVFRYYLLLILPISLALGAIILRIARLILDRKSRSERNADCDRFVILFAVWWLLDMSFVWISPRSYEQYYLPLNASAAMLGGYLIAAYSDMARNSSSKATFRAIGAVSLMVMMGMSLHIFRGVFKSPHSGVINRNRTTGQPERYRGYVQKLATARAHRKGSATGPWENAGQYIRENSQPGDGIYVWGWFPGIYVSSQRLSPAPKAFEGTMHTLSPGALSQRIDEILNSFKDKPPKFIVDSRKSHFPWDRPPLELWPIVRFQGMEKQAFLPLDQQAIENYDKLWSDILNRSSGGTDEAERYKTMAPFREYIRENYDIAETRQYAYTPDGKMVHMKFGEHVVFKLKDN